MPIHVIAETINMRAAIRRFERASS